MHQLLAKPVTQTNKMARFILLFLCFVLICNYSSGYLIRGRNLDDINTKEIQVIKEDGDNIIDGDVQSPPVIDIISKKKCAAIGEFCNNHSDCCSNSCLGYMKRCVS